MEFRILGPLEVLDGSRPVVLGASKQRALLGVLLLHANEVVPAERLVDELWGERPPASAGKLIQGYVFELRKALGADAIETRPPGYAIRVVDDALDLARFRRLATEAQTHADAGEHARAGARFREALALWRGRALADVQLEGPARHEGDRLEDVRLETVSSRVESDLACGQHGELVSELEALVAEHPLRERPRAQLMLALYRSGRQADALAAYRETSQLFRDDLGIDPSRELQALERAILDQDASLELPPRRPPTNLPASLTHLIGRERELADAGSLLRKHRLVTLTGPGGVGKTRLALEVASEGGDAFPDGAVWVPLQALRGPELVLATIAQAVGSVTGGDERIGQRRLLLVLDNLEHLLGSASGLAELLAAAQNAKLLVTSREPLHVRGEHEYPVAPLPESEAVVLFTERARAVRPDFVGNGGVAEICSRLDGLPLALELAAARVKALSVEQLLQRLEQRLPLLVSGPRDAPERQQTLHATIAWSYDLLTPEEQRLFARLAVFAGGCTPEAAEEVCRADLDSLQSLVDKSLLVRTGDRFTMLETIREYARERLAAADEAVEIDRRHAEHFLGIAEALSDTEESGSVVALESERDNLRAALAWLRDADEAELALRLAAALGSLWRMRGPMSEARVSLEDALARSSETTPARVQALIHLSAVARAEGDQQRHTELAEESLVLVRSLQDAGVLGAALVAVADIAAAAGDWLTAARYIDESAHVWRETRSEPLFSVLFNTGWAALARRDFARARARWEESYELAQRLDSPLDLAFGGLALGQLSLLEEQPEAAASELREALRFSHEQGLTALSIACLAALATVAAAREESAQAAALLGAAEKQQEALGANVLDSLPEQELWERTTSAVRDALRPEQLAEAWARGRALSLDEAVDYALAVD